MQSPVVYHGSLFTHVKPIFRQVSQLVSAPIGINLPGTILQGTVSNTLLKVASRYLHFSPFNTNGSI